MIDLKSNKRSKYFLGFVFLLIIEILIALYVKDDFIRPYLGDFLVVILLYCFLMWVSRFSIFKAMTWVLLFSFAVEFFQLIDIVNKIAHQPPTIIMIVLGSSFSWLDLLAYSLGILLCFFIELAQPRNRQIVQSVF